MNFRISEFFLPIYGLCFVVCASFLMVSCGTREEFQHPTLPIYANGEAVKQTFEQSRSDFEAVKDSLLKEPANKIIYNGRTTTSTPENQSLSEASKAACDKLMSKVNAFTIIKLSGAIRVELNHAERRNHVEELSITYDPQRQFAQPHSRFGLKRTLQELSPGWFYISDSLDVTNIPRIERFTKNKQP